MDEYGKPVVGLREELISLVVATCVSAHKDPELRGDVIGLGTKLMDEVNRVAQQGPVFAALAATMVGAAKACVPSGKLTADEALEVIIRLARFTMKHGKDYRPA